MKNFKLNLNYIPKCGDYFSAVDWTDEEIKWLASNTPFHWWYDLDSKRRDGFNNLPVILHSFGTFGTATIEDLDENSRRITKDMILINDGSYLKGSVSKRDEYFEVIVHLFGLSEAASNRLRGIIEIGGLYRDTKPMLTLPDFSRHTHGKVHPVEVVGTLVYDDEETSPLLQPSPRSKKVYVADLSGVIYGIFTGRLTHGKAYDPLCCDDTNIVVLTDEGTRLDISKIYFKEVYLYDEDETLLTCRDIEFKEGDYLDLRKHTPEQIRHVAGYYKFYDLNELLDNGSWDIVEWDECCGFVGSHTNTVLSTEYTYDDIFYLGEV